MKPNKLENSIDLDHNQTTEMIYIVSPDYQHELFTSLRSLLASGTSFDRVVILCVGKRPKHWEFEDQRIVVEEVKSLNKNHFHSNKTYYLCTRQADRVVYLDSDTIIMKPIDYLWQNDKSDFIGRPATAYGREDWNQTQWLETLQSLNADETPYFNAGFFIFQNGAHRQLKNIWLEFTQKLLVGELMQLERRKFSDQYALALAVGVTGLSYKILDRMGQAYGWLNEPYEDTVLYHTGGHLFWNFADKLESYLGIKNIDLPKFKVSNLLNPIYIKRKLRYTNLYRSLKPIYTDIKKKIYRY